MKMAEGRVRAVVSGVKPEIDGGRHPVKRVVGEPLRVTADVFADGHDEVRGALLWRKAGQRKWHRIPLLPLGNDRFEAAFSPDETGVFEYTIQAWVDHFHTWRRDLEKRVAAGQDVSVDLLIGAGHVDAAVERTKGKAGKKALAAAAESLRDEEAPVPDRVAAALDPELLARMDEAPELGNACTYDPVLRVVVDRARAGFSTWYEVFPRSTSPDPDRPGTLTDLAERLPDIAAMGFDVAYLPPIHPIGRTKRKGRNNRPAAEEGDVGSPWAIGADEGGHDAIHPDLGTPEDLRALVARARELGMEIALDVAFQCSPDHPWAKEHPEWFKARPDGTIQYAENPPKKYEDIYPIDFETEDWKALWQELHRVVAHWVSMGVRIFRVDNPHTKSFRFWEWLIAKVKKDDPDVLFLSEAFTRPKVMYHLAKIGFTWSYTYFTWREGSFEFREYLTELTRTEVADFFRPHFWPNTPDILPEHLQVGGRAMFLTRLVLAATLSTNYGMYGPAFELLESTPREAGSEEYLHSEKYEVKHWDLDRPGHLREEIALVNRIRREEPALRERGDLTFHPTSNDQLLCYSRRSLDGENAILCVVNLEPRFTHSGWTELDLAALGAEDGVPFEVTDLVDGSRYVWQGPRNYVELDPEKRWAHVFRVGGPARREQDFEHYG